MNLDKADYHPDVTQQPVEDQPFESYDYVTESAHDLQARLHEESEAFEVLNGDRIFDADNIDDEHDQPSVETAAQPKVEVENHGGQRNGFAPEGRLDRSIGQDQQIVDESTVNQNIREKAPERLYAQTAAFAAEQEYPHGHLLSQKIGEAATALHGGESISTEYRDWKEEVEERAFTPGQFVEFLRGAGPETRADIKFLASKMQAYAQFEGSVSSALENATENDEHYLGRGSNGKAFKFEQDGREFAVKTGGVGYRDISVFRRGKDIENIAHLEAIDLDRTVSVMNLVPGYPLNTPLAAQ